MDMGFILGIMGIDTKGNSKIVSNMVKELRDSSTEILTKACMNTASHLVTANTTGSQAVFSKEISKKAFETAKESGRKVQVTVTNIRANGSTTKNTATVSLHGPKETYIVVTTKMI